MSILEIPLFPLNTVLFPGMPLHLHIFEDRYKQMIRDCQEKRVPFGVVLIRHGFEALGPLAEPYKVGCTARIVQIQPLSEGRMNIVAIGQDRFRILKLDKTSASYLSGLVETYSFEDPNSKEELFQSSSRLRPLVERYLNVLSNISEIQFDLSQIPDDPTSFAYLAAIALQVPDDQKQQFLAKERVSELLADLRCAYRREVALVNSFVAAPKHRKIGNFSIN